MMLIGQFEVDGCHLDGGRAQCGFGDHQGGGKVVVQELHVQGRCRELERPGPIDRTPCARNIEMVVGE